MKFTVNIEKRYLVLICTLFVFITGIIVATSYTSQIPNPGHGGDKILISISGSEKTLQQAINDGDFTSNFEQEYFNDDCRWICGSYGTFLSCSSNEVVKGACGSGGDADCKTQCSGSQFHAIKCCS